MARTRSGARLWRHPNGTYYIVWTGAAGTQRISCRTKDRGAAESYLAKWQAGELSPAAPEVVTIAPILDGYLDERDGQVRAHATLVYACKPLKRVLGKLEPAHLNRGVLRQYAETRLKEGRSPGTIIREIVTLRAALKWAKGEKWIDDVPELPMPVSAPPPRDRWLTRDEARRLVEAATSPHVRLFILLALKTAARRGAILDLTWDRVDLDARRINYGRGWGNKNRNVVPIDDQLYEALVEAKRIACTRYVMEYNCHRTRSIRRGFTAAVRRAGLEGVTPHTLRHTAATWAVMEGVPVAEVARLLGDSEKMVEKVYGKHSPTYLKRAVEALRL